MTHLRHNLTTRLRLYARNAFYPVEPSLYFRSDLLRIQLRPHTKTTMATHSNAPLLRTVSCLCYSLSPPHFPATSALRHSPILDVDQLLLTLKLSTILFSLCTQAAT